MKANSKFILVCFSIIVFIIPFYLRPDEIKADTMRSSQYEIEAGNINIGAQPQTSDNFNLTTSIGQTAAGQFSSTGYIVKAGFLYLNSIIPFTFSISDITTDFGTLTPQTPTTQTANLTVSFGGAGLYQVTAQELGPMTTLGESGTIPDTSCNGGAETCDENQANVWNSASTYGFGFNMSGDDIPIDFVDSTYYRRFSDGLENEPPVEIMQSNNVSLDPEATPRNTSQSTVTYKVNISGSQQAGIYQTIIKYIATPSY